MSTTKADALRAKLAKLDERIALLNETRRNAIELGCGAEVLSCNAALYEARFTHNLTTNALRAETSSEAAQ